MKFANAKTSTIIPTSIVGPMNFVYNGINEQISVPLATFEIPLWYSTKRGALVSQKTSGIKTYVIDDFMTRSIILESDDLESILKCRSWIETNQKLLAEIIEKTSRYTKLHSINIENVGRLLYVRLSMETGNASGHNMTTKAADAIAGCIVFHCKDVRYISVSGNYCTDKKNSSINGILGRGKRVSAEIVVPQSACESILKTTPQKIATINVKKNLIGSILSGGVRTANAHYANIVLAMYLATGQDAANIVEASQGITVAEIDNGDLYFSVTIPNIIVGTVGNGKNLDFAQKNLELMKCHSYDPNSSKRLAAIIGATALCAELSLMAAQTNEGELIESHVKLERIIQ
jgi:hydroxymethylglutaryl-CoA reductase (NADPH)